GLCAPREVEVRRGREQIARRRDALGNEAHADELVWFVERQIAQEHVVDDRADADRDADADTERRDDAAGETWRASQPAKGEARVANEIVERDDAAGVARFFAEALCAAECESGGSARVGFAHAAANVLRGFHFYMEGELLVLFRCDARAAAEELAHAS